MRIFLSFLAFLFLISSLQSQGHRDVFPELEGLELFQALQDDYSPVELMDYSNTRDTLFGLIDQKNDTLYGIFTQHGVYIPPGADPTDAAFKNGAADGINTEHSWPRSKGARHGNAERDMHHLYPSKTPVNADRANFPFQNVPSQETITWYFKNIERSTPPPDPENYSRLGAQEFEPRDAVKGDIARSMMYFYTIYRDEADREDPQFFTNQRAAVCQWHLDDPVDQKEWDRTHQIAKYQEGKENPFVLDCTLAHRLYCFDFDPCTPMTSAEDPSSGSQSLQINPNPARESFWIDLPANFESERFLLEIYSSTGRKVREYNGNSFERQSYSLEGLPTGMYWIRCIVLPETEADQMYHGLLIKAE